jgi:hypothetical protein
MHGRRTALIDELLTPTLGTLTSGSQRRRHPGPMGDFVAILSFVAFIAAFLTYIWCLERV